MNAQDLLTLTVADQDGVLIHSIEISVEDFLEAQQSGFAAKVLLEEVRLGS
jgi:hypothetical protein